MERLGYCGLGIMGGAMARNLVRAGFTVSVWNRSPGRAEAMVAAGATRADSPAAVARSSDIICLCVSDTTDVESVLFGPDGIAAGARAGALIIDFSSISPDATRDFALRLARQGVALVDAPVTGGAEGAQKGTLSILVGGADHDVQRAMPVFQAVGRTITHLGPSGSGQTAKLVNQVLVVVNTLAMSEGLLLAAKAGLDLRKTVSAIAPGAGGSWMFQVRAPQILSGDFRPGFSIDLQQKDLRLVFDLAGRLGLDLAATRLAFAAYDRLIADGHGGDGNHAMITALEPSAGIQARAPA